MPSSNSTRQVTSQRSSPRRTPRRKSPQAPQYEGIRGCPWQSTKDGILYRTGENTSITGQAPINRSTCRKILAEIEELILANDSPLCWTIARELADFTVAFITSNDDQLLPAGTGTLVSFRDSHYFLTAAHVWEGALKKSDSIRIPLKEKQPLPLRNQSEGNRFIRCSHSRAME